MNKNKEEKILQERFKSGASFRTLALKHGLSYGCVYRMVNKGITNPGKENEKAQVKSEDLPDDVKLLKELLRKERLKTELLNNIIDIADKELGTNIRKKSGTKRSE
jgi:hypothetical protein